MKNKRDINLSLNPHKNLYKKIINKWLWLKKKLLMKKI